MMKNNYYVQTALKCCYQCKREELIKDIAEYMEKIKISCGYFAPHLIFDECIFGYDDDTITKNYHNKIKNRYFSDYIRLLQKNKLKHNIEYSHFINAMEKFNLFSYLEKSIITDDEFSIEQMFHNEYFNKNNNEK